MKKKTVTLNLEGSKYTRLDRAVALDISIGLTRKVQPFDIASISAIIYNAVLNGMSYARKNFTEKEKKELEAALGEALSFIDEAEKKYGKPFGGQGEA